MRKIMNKTILVGADVQKNGIRYLRSKYVPHLMEPLNALLDDKIKSITVYKHQSTGPTELLDHSVFNNAVMKSRQCGLMGTAGLRFLMGIQNERFMISDIEKKRTPDYVKKSMEGLKL